MTIHAPSGALQRLRARARLTVGYAGWAELRQRSLASSEPDAQRAFVRALARKLGIALSFTPHALEARPELGAPPIYSELDAEADAAPRPVPTIALALPMMPGFFGATRGQAIDVWNEFVESATWRAGGHLADLALYAGLVLALRVLRATFIRQAIDADRKATALVIGGRGTRGKSGTERLKAAFFQGLGFENLVKTMGCEAMFIHSMPEEHPSNIALVARIARHKPARWSDYVLKNSCITCGAPEAEAPDLMAFDERETSCYFRRQPIISDETYRAIRAVRVSCCEAVRYGVLPRLEGRFAAVAVSDERAYGLTDRGALLTLPHGQALPETYRSVRANGQAALAIDTDGRLLLLRVQHESRTRPTVPLPVPLDGPVRLLAVGYDRACVVDIHGKVLCLPFEPTATFFGRTQATSVGAGVRMLDELEDGSIACWGAMDEPGTLVWSRQCSRPLLGSNVWCAETPASIYLPTSFVPYKKSEP